MQRQSAFISHDLQRHDFALAADSGASIGLLDYFAANALNGILASTHNCSPQVCARLAYEYASAMLSERQRALAEAGSEEGLRQVAQAS